jgi:hypothetical protein
MGLIGKILSFGAGFLPFKKGGKVQRRNMATGGLVLDNADKQALASLVSKAKNAGVPLKKGGRVKKMK